MAQAEPMPAADTATTRSNLIFFITVEFNGND